MKCLIAAAALICLFSPAFDKSAAQNNAWIEVSPNGEFFSVSMPNQPTEKEQARHFEEIDANGKLYESEFEGVSYKVWSLADSKYRSTQDVDGYLDACADLIWGDLLKAAREQLPEDVRARARMTYAKELPPTPFPGREYSFTLGAASGTTHFYVATSRIYVLMVVHPAGGVRAQEKFFPSFVVSGTTLMPPQINADPGGYRPVVTNSDPTDYNRIFSGREVTQKARVLEKPEPTYTETARMFGVEGAVVLRAVFSKSGEVANLHVVRKLPHGLTQQAITAARAIRFTPAMKDGQPVSMWMELQYNFNLY
jgi:TonB family protein